MRYIGSVYRPPSEAYSLIVQVTLGCAHNDCTFCSMFKDKPFSLRKEEDILRDFEEARRAYRRVERIFLADGDALVLKTDKLLRILDKIRALFPECERVGIYGSPQDALRKTREELVSLRDAGLGIVYIGAESGSDRVLLEVKKGATRAQIIEAIEKIEDAGIAASATFISGLAGRKAWREHAIECGTMISEASPSYIGLLTLMVEPPAPLCADIREGRFELLSPMEVLEETRLLLEHTEVRRSCVFRSNHASNYVSLRGTLPQDKARMLARLDEAMQDAGMLKDERFRML
ncbi:MAG: B12-binding domain-containing radical SAM protein [Clostridiales Family XIII bacterium]|nr:B12-binding domain-containing radical SAM protein [Clostridiales Family XIII bacterium]